MKNSKYVLFFLAGILPAFLASSTLFAAEKEIKIGVLYPLSGAAATIGRDLQRAAEMTADLVNNKNPQVDMLMATWGGIPNLGGAKIKLIFADHRGEPDRGADLAKRLVDVRRVFAAELHDLDRVPDDVE